MIGATLAEGQDRTLWRHFMMRWTFSLEDVQGTALGDWVEEKLHIREEQVRVQEKAEDVLMVLRTRGVPLDETEQARIADCHDLDLLKLWLTRALTADTAAQIFTQPTVIRPRGTTTPV